MASLTVKGVERAQAGRHSDGNGLYLLVSPSRSMSWMLRIQVGHRRRDIGLGSVVVLSLAEAREKAAKLRKAAKQGKDPIAVRDKEKTEIPTFAKAAEACHEARKRGWKDRHAEAFLASLKLHAYPRIGRLQVDSVDESDLVAVLSPLWHDKPAAARKLRQRVNTVLDYAKGRNWRRTGAPRDGLRPLLSKQAKPGNFAAMPYEDVPAFVRGLRKSNVTAGRLALAFAIVTAARSGEVRTAKWSHINLERKLWTRPALLMKAGEEHEVTLSDSAVMILGQAAKMRTTDADCLIFPGKGGGPLADMTLLKIVKSDGRGFSVHGFRSAFRTWAAEKMPSVPEAVAEAALAHTIPDAVVRAYQRSKFINMRHDLLAAWADFVAPL